MHKAIESFYVKSITLNNSIYHLSQQLYYRVLSPPTCLVSFCQSILSLNSLIKTLVFQCHSVNHSSTKFSAHSSKNQLLPAGVKSLAKVHLFKNHEEKMQPVWEAVFLTLPAPRTISTGFLIGCMALHSLQSSDCLDLFVVWPVRIFDSFKSVSYPILLQVWNINPLPQLNWSSTRTLSWTRRGHPWALMPTATGTATPARKLQAVKHNRSVQCMSRFQWLKNAILCQWADFPRRIPREIGARLHWSARWQDTSATYYLAAASRPASPLIPVLLLKPWLERDVCRVKSDGNPADNSTASMLDRTGLL